MIRLILWRILGYLVFISTFYASFIFGRIVSFAYHDNILNYLPKLLTSYQVNLLFLVIFGILFLRMENAYIWRGLWGMKRYETAPITLGFVVGLVSVWIDNRPLLESSWGLNF